MVAEHTAYHCLELVICIMAAQELYHYCIWQGGLPLPPLPSICTVVSAKCFLCDAENGLY